MSMLRKGPENYAHERFKHYNSNPCNMRPILLDDGDSIIIIQDPETEQFIRKPVPEGLKAILTMEEWVLADTMIDGMVIKSPSLPQYLVSKYPKLSLDHSSFMALSNIIKPPMLIMAGLPSDNKIIMERNKEHPDKLVVRCETSGDVGFALLSYHTRPIIRGHTYQMVCIIPPNDASFRKTIKDRVFLWSAMSHPQRSTYTLPHIDYSSVEDVNRFCYEVIECIINKEEEGFIGNWALVYPKDGLLNCSLCMTRDKDNIIEEVGTGVTALMDIFEKVKEKGIIKSTLTERISYEPPPEASNENGGISKEEVALIERSFQLIHIESESLRIIESIAPTLVQLDEEKFDIISSISAYFIPRGEQNIGIIDFIID